MADVYKTYEHLYHYTDRKGLEGILESQSIWATNYKKLNDHKEITLFAQETLPEFFKPEIAKVYTSILHENEQLRDNFFQGRQPIEDLIDHDTTEIINALFFGIQENIYIASFSGEVSDQNIVEHGKLSQWRGYGNNEGRFCIEFDTKKLEELNKIEFNQFSYMGLGLGDIVYSDEKDKFETKFKTEITAMNSFIAKMIGYISDNKFHDLEKIVPYSEYLSMISRYKHFGFKEETEVRIYAHLISENIQDPENRQKKPYVMENTIALFKDIEKALPITRIIIGPHSKQEENKQWLQEKLKDTDIKITVSKIPFLG